MQTVTEQYSNPYLISSSKQAISRPHVCRQLICSDWFKVLLMCQGIPLQLDACWKKVQQCLFTESEFNSGYLNRMRPIVNVRCSKAQELCAWLNRQAVAEDLVAKPAQPRIALTRIRWSIRVWNGENYLCVNPRSPFRPQAALLSK